MKSDKVGIFILWFISTGFCWYWFYREGDLTALNMYVWAPFMGFVILAAIAQTFMQIWISFHIQEVAEDVRDFCLGREGIQRAQPRGFSAFLLLLFVLSIFGFFFYLVFTD
jgi:hypothetical protein